MAEIYHIKIKKEYASALIDDLLKVEAIENIENMDLELPQWQKDALDKELLAIESDRSNLTSWNSVKDKFSQPE